jgi:large subunit ribosomal protein L20
MARIKRGLTKRKRHKRLLKEAEGYWGRKKSNYKIAHEQVMKSAQYAYRDRRTRKRDFRRLWITRITAACLSLPQPLKYSQFINGLKKAGIALDRKTLSEMAIHDPSAFSALAERARSALG